MMIRLLIADDHADVRQRLARIVEGCEELELVAVADSGFAALDAVARRPIDVALVDIAMPGPPFLDLIRAIRAARPETRVLIVTVHTDPAYAAEALRAGAAGLLAKERADRELVAAIRQIRAGGRYIGSAAGAPPAARPPC